MGIKEKRKHFYFYYRAVHMDSKIVCKKSDIITQPN